MLALPALLGLAGLTPAHAREETAAPRPDEPKKTRLQGSAFIDRNDKVPGMTVVATPEDDPSRVYITATDRRGAFKIDGMPEGDYRVLMRREGFRPVTKRHVLLKYPFRAVVEIQVQPIDKGIPILLEQAPGDEEQAMRDGAPAPESGSIDGAVVDLAGEPVSEIDVRLSPVDSDTDPRFLRSDDSGAFATGGLEPGRWHIDAHALGYLPMRAEFDVRGPLQLKMVAVPQPGDYEPSPLDLMPTEEPVPPPVLTRN